jgi:hypothetical protein
MHTVDLTRPGPEPCPPHPTGAPSAGRAHAAAPAAWAVAVALLLGGGTALAASARPAADAGPSGPSGRTAASTPSGEPATTGAAAGAPGAATLRAEWDGPATHLDWRGRTYATAEASFVGDRVAAPGDRTQRTLHLINAGPAGAVLTLTLVLHDPGADPDGETDLGEALTLFWDVAGGAGAGRLADLRGAGPRVDVAQVRVPHGESAAVTVGFTVPAETTGARSGGAEAPAVALDVLARLEGEAEPAAVPALALTGARLGGLVALALGLLVAGWLVVAAARGRARCCACGALVGDRGARRRAGWARGAPVRCGRCPLPAGAVLILVEAGS